MPFTSSSRSVTVGYEASVCNEKGIAKAAAKLTYAFANATVPKVNVIVGQAMGTAANIMNAKTIGADLTIAWEGAKIGVMEARISTTYRANIMCRCRVIACAMRSARCFCRCAKTCDSE